MPLFFLTPPCGVVTTSSRDSCTSSFVGLATTTGGGGGVASRWGGDGTGEGVYCLGDCTGTTGSIG